MLKSLEIFRDENGTLSTLNKNLGFAAKRFFYVTGVKELEWRGDHAHRNNKQILVCVKGKILVLLDDGECVRGHTLNEGEYIFVDSMVWDKQQYLTGNDILLSICSTEYDKDDYIKSYDQFLEELK